VEREALYRTWRDRAQEAGIRFEKPEANVGRGFYENSPWEAAIAQKAAQRAVAFAVSHHTERQSIVTYGALADTALKQGIGKVRLADVDAEVRRRVDEGYMIRERPLYRLSDAKDGDLGKTAAAWSAELESLGIDRRDAKLRTERAIYQGRLLLAEARYTTQTARAREKVILASEASGREAVTPIVSAADVQARIATAGLTKGRAEAAEVMLTSSNRVVGIQGLAGTGKTYMLKSAASIAEAEGFTVRAIASYGSQVNVLRSEGLKANTLAAFVNAKEKEIDTRSIVILDEAGVCRPG
jgi:hypothetical protein